MKKLQVLPNIDNQIKINDFIQERLTTFQAPKRVKIQMNIVIDEIFSNILKYSQATQIIVECQAKLGFILVRFLDNGSPYDPLKIPEPDITLSLEHRPIGGLGFFIVCKSMDRVWYEFKSGWNILSIEKRWTIITHE